MEMKKPVVPEMPVSAYKQKKISNKSLPFWAKGPGKKKPQKREIKNSMLLTIVQKSEKLWSINITKHAQQLYAENC